MSGVCVSVSTGVCVCPGGVSRGVCVKGDVQPLWTQRQTPP